MTNPQSTNNEIDAVGALWGLLREPLETDAQLGQRVAEKIKRGPGRTDEERMGAWGEGYDAGYAGEPCERPSDDDYCLGWRAGNRERKRDDD